MVIREVRVPVGDYEYGFPAGLLDPGEDLAVAAGRELREEIGPTTEIFTNPGHQLTEDYITGRFG